MADTNDAEQAETGSRRGGRAERAVPRSEIEPQSYAGEPTQPYTAAGGASVPVSVASPADLPARPRTANTEGVDGRAETMSVPDTIACDTRWKTIAESVRGVSHEKTGMVCQDRNFYLALPGDVLIAAVADGAGSASKAEIGAETAAHYAVNALHRAISTGRKPVVLWEADEAWGSLVTSIFEETLAEVEAEAERQGLPARELASTLILFLATPDMVAVGQIGDGAVVVSDYDSNLTALTLPQSGEYLNETTFLVSPKAVEQAQTFVWHGPVCCLAAFSDGLQMLALNMSDSTPHPPFFQPLFRFVREAEDMAEATNQLSAFLRSPRITQRADDDLTLLLAHFARPVR